MLNRRQLGQTLAIGLAWLMPAIAEAKSLRKTMDVKTLKAALARVRARFGGQLSKEDEKRVARSVQHKVRMAESLRKVPVANSDDPACAFRADLP
jgi:hypothetical protein